MEELKGSALKIEAFQNYLKIAKAIKAFELDKFEQWKGKTLEVIEMTLKMNVLKVEAKKIPSMYNGDEREYKLDIF